MSDSETITWAYVFLIHERLTQWGEKQSWEAFAGANADLLDWQHSMLKAYYRDETLRSELARQVFVFPDRARSGPIRTVAGLRCAPPPGIESWPDLWIRRQEM